MICQRFLLRQVNISLRSQSFPSVEKFRQFLQEFESGSETGESILKYKKRLDDLKSGTSRVLEISLDDLKLYNSQLCDNVCRNTKQYLEIAYNCVDEINGFEPIVHPENPSDQLRVSPIPFVPSLSVELSYCRHRISTWERSIETIAVTSLRNCVHPLLRHEGSPHPSDRLQGHRLLCQRHWHGHQSVSVETSGESSYLHLQDVWLRILSRSMASKLIWSTRWPPPPSCPTTPANLPSVRPTTQMEMWSWISKVSSGESTRKSSSKSSAASSSLDTFQEY